MFENEGYSFAENTIKFAHQGAEGKENDNISKALNNVFIANKFFTIYTIGTMLIGKTLIIIIIIKPKKKKR